MKLKLLKKILKKYILEELKDFILRNPNLTAKEYADLLDVKVNYIKELLKEIEILEIQEEINRY